MATPPAQGRSEAGAPVGGPHWRGDGPSAVNPRVRACARFRADRLPPWPPGVRPVRPSGLPSPRVSPPRCAPAMPGSEAAFGLARDRADAAPAVRSWRTAERAPRRLVRCPAVRAVRAPRQLRRSWGRAPVRRVGHPGPVRFAAPVQDRARQRTLGRFRPGPRTRPVPSGRWPRRRARRNPWSSPCGQWPCGACGRSCCCSFPATRRVADRG